MKKESIAAVYLGPSFYGIIQKGTVLKGGYPEKFQVLLTAHPFLTGLLVPTSDLAKKRMQLTERESELALLHRRATQLKEEMHV